MNQHKNYSLGATWLGDGQAHFLVWAQDVEQVAVYFTRDDRTVALQRGDKGYFAGLVDGLQPDEQYFYILDGEKKRPDPASRYQPDGVHGASQLIVDDFQWTDDGFMPPNLRNTVIYELHVGTFTQDGTFAALTNQLPYFTELGITTIEIMPVAQTPGERNWGYDGVQLYAPNRNYGTPNDFKTLVNAAHNHGIAVYLDVVYNHLGPEGNYLWDYAPYFTDKYGGVWGDSINFDGRNSDEVRRFFVENAIYWLDEFHIDGLRLDATHALLDFSAVPFLEYLATQVHDWADANNRRIHLIAESDKRNRKTVLPRDVGGVGLDGQWLDDLHHTVHVMLTDETRGYFADFADFDTMVKVLKTRFGVTGGYSKVAGRSYGTDASDIPADRFVTSVQTHDQVGNRMVGDRLSHRSDFEACKLAAGYLLTAPYTPMLFMGQEYAETAPFQFFTHFGDEQLIESVRQGREEEFAYFAEQGSPPDPHAESTFMNSKLNLDLRHEGKHALLFKFYQTVLQLRRTHPALTNPHPNATHVVTDSDKRIMCMERRSGAQVIRVICNWDLEQTHSYTMPDSAIDVWYNVLDSNAVQWQLNANPARRAVPMQVNTGETIALPPRTIVLYAAQIE